MPGGSEGLIAELDQLAGDTRHTAAPRVTRYVRSDFTIEGEVGSSRRRLVLLWRDGQLGHVAASVTALHDHAVLAPTQAEHISGIRAGSRLLVALPTHQAALFAPDVVGVETTPDGGTIITHADHTQTVVPPPPPLPLDVIDTLLAHAEQVGAVESRTMGPIRLAGAAAGALLLTGAAVLVARERRRELRLRLLRGDPPWTLALRIAGRQAAPIAAGTLIGGALALLAVVTIGPTPELEPAPVRGAAIAALVGAVVATLLVGAVAAVVATGTVDRTSTHRLRWVPWELLVVGLPILSWRHLDDAGGVRLIGGRAVGGDILAQAFPLVALAAPLAVLSRPLMWLARRSRRWGRGLPVPVLRGLRRVGAEPAASVTVVSAVALAVGAFVVSTAMTDSARQLLADNASVFLGGDETVNVTEVLPVPGGLSGTVIAQTDLYGPERQENVTALGVDAGTLACGMRWRGDASDRQLEELLALIAHPPPGPAAGDRRRQDPAEHDSGDTHAPRVAGATGGDGGFLPGQRNRAVLVIVDRDALEASGISVAEQVWLRDPPADATTLLRQAGFNVGATRRTPEVFDVISFLAVKWSYGAMTAFGVMIASVVVLAQLLVLDARRRTRQADIVLTRPMGLSTGGLSAAVLTELAIPFVGGTILGMATAVALLHLAVPRLDTLRQLQPPARVILDLGAAGIAVAVGVLALAALTAIGVLGVRRAEPTEVMRSGA